MINLEDVKTISLGPDQVLVVQVQTRSMIKQDQRTYLTQYLENIFPDNKVMVIDESIKLLIVDQNKLVSEEDIQ